MGIVEIAINEHEEAAAVDRRRSSVFFQAIQGDCFSGLPLPRHIESARYGGNIGLSISTRDKTPVYQSWLVGHSFVFVIKRTYFKLNTKCYISKCREKTVVS